MNTIMRQFGTAAVLAPLMWAQAYGDGFRNPPPSASGLGAVGARYTLNDDVSASVYNPANLVSLEQAGADVSVTAVKSEKKIRLASGASVEIKDDVYLLPNIFAAAPVESGRAVLGFSLTTPYGQATEFDQTSALRYAAPYLAEMRFINAGPVLAYKAREDVSLAVGLNVAWSDLELRQILPWGVVVNNPAVPDGQVRLEGDGVGFGGQAALTWKPAKGHRVGLVYKSAMDLDYEGNVHLSGIPAPGLGLPSSSFDTTLKFPNLVGVGYGIEVNDRLSVGADIEWIEWSRYEALSLDAGANAPLLQPSTIPQKWDDAFNFGLGAVCKLDEQWTARAGYIFLQTPVPDETLLPSLPENDQHVVTVGLGYEKSGHRINVSYGLGLYEDRDVRNNQNPAFNGTYEFLSHLAAISYGVDF